MRIPRVVLPSLCNFRTSAYHHDLPSSSCDTGITVSPLPGSHFLMAAADTSWVAREEQYKWVDLLFGGVKLSESSGCQHLVHFRSQDSVFKYTSGAGWNYRFTGFSPQKFWLSGSEMWSVSQGLLMDVVLKYPLENTLEGKFLLTQVNW